MIVGVILNRYRTVAIRGLEEQRAPTLWPAILQQRLRQTRRRDQNRFGIHATMPGKIPFTVTRGQMFNAGTKAVNLAGKGVTPDIRIPIDDDYVRRRMKGEDVVLAEAVKYLEKQTAPTAGQ